MSETELTGEVVPVPPDGNLASEISGPSGLAGRVPDIAFLYEPGEGAEADLSDTYRSIIDQILSAETPDQILTPVEVKQPRDVVGEPLEIFAPRWQRSDFEVGSPMYASLEARQISDGMPVVVNCGQKTLMAQVVRLQQLGAFPIKAYFRETGHNSHGTPMYRLTRLPDNEQGTVPF